MVTFLSERLSSFIAYPSDDRSIPVCYEDRTPTHGYAETREAAMTAFPSDRQRIVYEDHAVFSATPRCMLRDGEIVFARGTCRSGGAQAVHYERVMIFKFQ
jgi:hypothetical protein